MLCFVCCSVVLVLNESSLGTWETVLKLVLCSPGHIRAISKPGGSWCCPWSVVLVGMELVTSWCYGNWRQTPPGQLGHSTPLARRLKTGRGEWLISLDRIYAL